MLGLDARAPTRQLAWSDFRGRFWADCASTPKQCEGTRCFAWIVTKACENMWFLKRDPWGAAAPRPPASFWGLPLPRPETTHGGGKPPTWGREPRNEAGVSGDSPPGVEACLGREALCERTVSPQPPQPTDRGLVRRYAPVTVRRPYRPRRSHGAHCHHVDQRVSVSEPDRPNKYDRIFSRLGSQRPNQAANPLSKE